MTRQPCLGAVPLAGGRCEFLAWAPRVRSVAVRVVAPHGFTAPLDPGERGYFHGIVEGVPAGSRYVFRLDDAAEFPDPASRSQPEGVHGPSEVVDAAFPWTDGDWRGHSLADSVFYEIHVGTFTPEGTFDAIIPRLDALRDLGVTAIELMPVAQFPGARNWGYDGVFPFAAQNSCGGLRGLQRLVDACHARGLSLVLDVVYNHLGPEGNYTAHFGLYFTDSYRTPWGEAVNLDGPGSDEVRRFFIENALYWATECHVDALRLDALHALVDTSARPFLAELSRAVRARAGVLGRRIHLIAESDANDPRLLRPEARSGMGLDAWWNEDFHHALHSVVTGERDGYYADFGGLSHLAGAMRRGVVLGGGYSVFRRRRHGAPFRGVAPRRLLAFSQNHDQVGNRPCGERLSALVSFEAQKLAAGCVILSPFTPLLFMGEEYGETAPFLYFVDHGDPDLLRAVREGRARECGLSPESPEALDPGSGDSFVRSRLDWGLWERGGRHGALRAFYREALALRRGLLSGLPEGFGRPVVRMPGGGKILFLLLGGREPKAAVLAHFGGGAADVRAPLPPGCWRVALSSADARFGGPGNALPPEVESPGEVPLTLPPWSVTALAPKT